MADNTYNLQEPTAITLTREQWHQVADFLEDCRCEHLARAATWLSAANKKTGGIEAAAHEKTAALADTLRMLIEAALFPVPAPETE